MIRELRDTSKFSLIMILVVAGLALSAHSDSNEPDVIFVGNPEKLTFVLRSKLPPGYKWTPNIDKVPLGLMRAAKIKALNSGEIFVTPESDFPFQFALLEEKTDLKNIIKQARENGKKSVYVFPEELDPSIPVVPLLINFDQIWSKPMDILYSWADSLNNLIVPETVAHNWPDSSCTSGGMLYAGTCVMADWVDDYPQDGKTPGALYCFHYTSRKCHWYNYGLHIYKNIGWPKQHSELPHISTSPEPVSFVNCMKGHHDDNWIVRPVDLTINIYQTGAEAGAAPGSCGFPVCGCGQQPPKTTPRTSEGNVIWIPSEDPVCNSVFSSLETVRHEISHNYGYAHEEMEINLEDVSHCINAGRDSAQNLQYPPLHTMY